MLAARAPALAAATAAAPIPPTHVLSGGEGESPLLTIDGIPLQHRGDPVADGVRWARAAVERLDGSRRDACVVIVGLGLGYHVEALAERFAGAIVVVEPDLAVLAAGAREPRSRGALLARVERRATATRADGDAARRASGRACSRTRRRCCSRAARIAARCRPGRRRRPAAALRSEGPGRDAALRRLVADRRLRGARAHRARARDAPARPGAVPRRAFAGLERFGARRANRRVLERASATSWRPASPRPSTRSSPTSCWRSRRRRSNAAALDAIGKRGVLRALWFVEDFRVMTYWRELARALRPRLHDPDRRVPGGDGRR